MGAGSMAGPTEDDRARDTATSAGSMPVILMYHSIAPYEHDPYQVTVSPARFEQQMRWLRRRGLRGASVREVLDARASGCGDRDRLARAASCVIAQGARERAGRGDRR